MTFACSKFADQPVVEQGFVTSPHQNILIDMDITIARVHITQFLCVYHNIDPDHQELELVFQLFHV